ESGAPLSPRAHGEGLAHARPRRRPFRLTSAGITNTERARDERARFVSGYFKNSSFHSPSHFGASASDLIGSTMTCLWASSSVFCVRLEGTRPMSPRSFWPSGESTKSPNRSAGWGGGPFAATAIAGGRPTSGSTTVQSIGPPFALIESALPL